MSKRAATTPVVDEIEDAKRFAVADDTQQLSVYKQQLHDDDDDDEVQHPNGNKMLCIFKTPTMTRDVTWMDKLRYNLNEKNLTVMNYNGKVFESLGFLRESLSIDDNINDFLPDVSTEIVVNKPKAPRVVFQVGKLLKGGMRQYYFFDFVRVKRAEGNFGQYLSITWPNQYLHNEAFARLIIAYKRWDCETMKLQNVTYVNMPNNMSAASKTAFARKFFDIRQEQNQQNYMTGQLKKKIVCEHFSLERFDEVFKFEEDSKCSAEIQMLAGVVIEGFKQSKEDTDYETVNCKTLQEKTYSLSIKPMVFFNIEE
jgi:ssDNA binding protein